MVLVTFCVVYSWTWTEIKTHALQEPGVSIMLSIMLRVFYVLYYKTM